MQFLPLVNWWKITNNLIHALKNTFRVDYAYLHVQYMFHHIHVLLVKKKFLCSTGSKRVYRTTRRKGEKRITCEYISCCHHVSSVWIILMCKVCGVFLFFFHLGATRSSRTPWDVFELHSNTTEGMSSAFSFHLWLKNDEASPTWAQRTV